MEKDTYKASSKQILIIVTSCGLLGLFTSVVSLVLIILNGTYPAEWLFLELCWIAAILFPGFIFYILIRKNKKVIKKNSASKENKSVSTVSTLSSN